MCRSNLEQVKNTLDKGDEIRILDNIPGIQTRRIQGIRYARTHKNERQNKAEYRRVRLILKTVLNTINKLICISSLAASVIS